MPVFKARPAWSLPTMSLLAKAKKHNVFLHSKGRAEMVVLHCGDPVGIFLSAPLRIERQEETGVILGTFQLNEAEVMYGWKKCRPRREVPRKFALALYSRKAKCFVHSIRDGEVDYVLKHPEIRYIDDVEQRKRILTLIEDEACLVAN